ncbi:MAG TPA: hypothetical protein VMV49_02945 [Candidatus Deferrimicrobium sp.]|nr:hypothetical protein [Candidatus Deferrimicrobium sp.]
MTNIENNSHYDCNVMIRHGCGMSWNFHVSSGGRGNFDTFHMCPMGNCGIFVVVNYSNGAVIQGPGNDDASVFISDNEIRPWRVSSL